MELRRPGSEELEKMLDMEEELTHRDIEIEKFRETFKRWPELYIVAEEDGEIIGEASGEVKDGKVLLESIAVREQYRGEGIGGKILESFCEEASNYSDTVSVASADNVESFYRSCGFRPEKILLQAEEHALPENWKNDDRVLDWREEDAGIFVYVRLNEYTPDVRESLKREFEAFEANTIMEREI